PPNRLDLITSVNGLVFKECYERKILYKFENDGLVINLISKKDLIKNKLATGRSQDIADVDNLPDD
nr:hypothetical protein [Ignavibacteria bacterium]